MRGEQADEMCSFEWMKGVRVYDQKPKSFRLNAPQAFLLPERFLSKTIFWTLKVEQVWVILADDLAKI